jgi:hypothetical protein
VTVLGEEEYIERALFQAGSVSEEKEIAESHKYAIASEVGWQRERE